MEFRSKAQGLLGSKIDTAMLEDETKRDGYKLIRHVRFFRTYISKLFCRFEMRNQSLYTLTTESPSSLEVYIRHPPIVLMSFLEKCFL